MHNSIKIVLNKMAQNSQKQPEMTENKDNRKQKQEKMKENEEK